MKNITVTELKDLLDQNAEVQIIDIREDHERDICAFEESIHIPMDQILFCTEKISKSGKVVIHCKAGDRASAVVLMLESRHGFSNVYNLQGGIMAWASTIDPEMAVY